MRTHKILAGLAALLVATWALAAQEGPVKPRVGDWTASSAFGPGGAITSKVTVIAVDETTATLKHENSFDGVAKPPTERKIELSVLSDPKNLVPRAGAVVKVETLNEGKETLTVNGTKLNCHWIEVKKTGNVKGKTLVTSAKIWTSSDVPVFGLVKMESPVLGGTQTTELLDYGRAK